MILFERANVDCPFCVRTVVEAKDLIAADFGGKSDPYVVLNLGGRQKKTSVKDATLSPTWNEEFVWDIEHEYSTTIRFECYDSDRFTKDDVLGVAVLTLPTTADQLSDLWVELENVDGTPLSKPSKLHVQVKLSSDRLSLLDHGLEFISFDEASSKLKTGDIVIWCEQGNNVFLTLQRALQGSNWVRRWQSQTCSPLHVSSYLVSSHFRFTLVSLCVKRTLPT